ncbi:MAG: GAF domain-containing sensor histidine kinase [Acidimicrobiales bacterium]
MTKLVVALRWVALALSVAAVGLRGAHRTDMVAVGLLTLLAVARTLWPFEPGVGAQGVKRVAWAALAGGLVELAVCAVLVAMTGAASSPFVVSLAGACFICGLVVPVRPGALVVVAGLVALGAAGATGSLTRSLASRYVEELAVLGALGVLGSYSEWLLQKDRETKDGQLEHLRELGEVNRLLLELHAKAASVPAGLSLRGAVATLAGHLRELLQPDVVVLMLAASASSGSGTCWEVALADGVELPDAVAPEDLVPVLREASRSFEPVCRCKLAPGEGVRAGAWTGLYVPLWARESLVGLFAVERVAAGDPFGSREVDMAESVARHAGLALDNARLLRQLRAMGAEEERVRIARELHDRVGQSLAYLALSLDTLQEEARTLPVSGSLDLSGELGGLAGEARKVLRELRTKLCDLRSEVTEQEGLVDALDGLLRRAKERSGIATALSVGAMVDLPAGVGREVARVAQEAINNAERHSGAAHIDVRLSWDGCAGELVVADDGSGLPAKASLRGDAYGILGMRERTEVIGGSLAISSRAGRGTKVTLRWGKARQG